jgi:DNA mismatch endonuclease, patch repair protein
MADKHSKEQRSYNMSKVKAKDTKPELLVRKYLHKNGLRYRLHVKEMPGKPDIVFPKYKTVIFINGCFWHGHENCKFATLPKTREQFWQNKITSNINRDKKAKENLRAEGWQVVTVWECELKPKIRDTTLSNLLKVLKY